MTYGTPVSCRFGAPALGPAPAKPRGVPVTHEEASRLMAAMAEAEGHAPRRMGCPKPRTTAEVKIDARVLAVLGKHGTQARRAIRRWTGLHQDTLDTALARLRAAGLVREEARKLANNHTGRVYALTPAGQAKVSP